MTSPTQGMPLLGVTGFYLVSGWTGVVVEGREFYVRESVQVTVSLPQVRTRL